MAHFAVGLACLTVFLAFAGAGVFFGLVAAKMLATAILGPVWGA